MTRYRTPHPFAPPRPGGSTLEELVDRHAHLVAVGLANCRAAQSLKREINRRIETQRASLANTGFNPDEPRDSRGRWTAEGDTRGPATNSPARPNLLEPDRVVRVRPNESLLAPDRLVRSTPDQPLLTPLADKVATDPSGQYKLNPLEQAEIEGGPSANREDYAVTVPPDLNPNYDFTRYWAQHPLAPLTETIQAITQAFMTPLERLEAAQLNAAYASGWWALGLKASPGPFKPGVPIVKFPHFTEQELAAMSPLGRKLAIAANAVSDDLSGLTTPGNLAILPLAPEFKVVQAAFLAQTASAFPDLVQNLVQARTEQERIAAWTHLMDNAVAGGLLTKGLLKEKAPAVSKTPPAEPPRIEGGQPTGPAGAPKPASPEPASLEGAPFKNGEVFFKEYSTRKGPVEFEANVEFDGDTLHLKGVSIFPKDAAKLSPGPGEALTILRTKIAPLAKAMGFKKLRISGQRISGANPDHIFDKTIDL